MPTHREAHDKMGVAATAPLEAATAPINDTASGNVVTLAHIDAARKTIMQRMQNLHILKEEVYRASRMQLRIVGDQLLQHD